MLREKQKRNPVLFKNISDKRWCHYGKTASYSTAGTIEPRVQQPEKKGKDPGEGVLGTAREWRLELQSFFPKGGPRLSPVCPKVGQLGLEWRWNVVKIQKK